MRKVSSLWTYEKNQKGLIRIKLILKKVFTFAKTNG